MTHATQSAAIQAAQRFTTTYPALETVTKPNLTTAEASHFLNRRPQTLRAWACLENGPIRPRRIGGILAWNTQEIKALAGVYPLQKGFSTLGYLACIIGMALLVQAVLMLFPGILGSMDWAGVAMLGAGVIGREKRHDMTSLVQAASEQGFSVHLSFDNGCPVFAVGCAEYGGDHEFSTYTEAMAWVHARAAA